MGNNDFINFIKKMSAYDPALCKSVISLYSHIFEAVGCDINKKQIIAENPRCVAGVEELGVEGSQKSNPYFTPAEAAKKLDGVVQSAMPYDESDIEHISAMSRAPHTGNYADAGRTSLGMGLTSEQRTCADAG